MKTYKKYCVIVNKEKVEVVMESSDLPFSGLEAETQLHEDYPDSQIKCFPKKKQAMDHLTLNLGFKALFDIVKTLKDENQI